MVVLIEARRGCRDPSDRQVQERFAFEMMVFYRRVLSYVSLFSDAIADQLKDAIFLDRFAESVRTDQRFNNSVHGDVYRTPPMGK